MITSALAILFSEKNDVVAIDCDVDAPNLALWLGIDTSIDKNAKFTKEISTVEKPNINRLKCQRCGKCIYSCNFGALQWNGRKVELIPYKCEGCGLCEYVCPSGAIKMKPVKNCKLSWFETKWSFPVIQGQIKPGEAESGEAVTEIRNYAQEHIKSVSITVQDAAAGIGCPVIASIKGSNFVVAACEPSKSSFSDLKRVLSVVEHFGVPFGIVINKYDLNDQISKSIKSFAKQNYLGKISYDKKIIKSIVNLEPIMESKLKCVGEIEEIYAKVVKQI
jgi:MinD superfamily P-loop ATPase